MALHLAILIHRLLFILSVLKAELKLKLKHAYFNDGFALLKTFFLFDLSRLKYNQNLSKGFKMILHSTTIFGLTFPF